MEYHTHNYIYDKAWDEISWQIGKELKADLLRQIQKHIYNSFLYMVGNSTWSDIMGQARDYLISQVNEDLRG